MQLVLETKAKKMTEEEILGLFLPVMVDLDDLDSLIKNRPLLAHYTSIDVLEKIMKTGELWLSNPLVRIPMKSAMHSNLKPATDSDLKPAGLAI
jgi:hypothetical protein